MKLLKSIARWVFYVGLWPIANLFYLSSERGRWLSMVTLSIFGTMNLFLIVRLFWLGAIAHPVGQQIAVFMAMFFVSCVYSIGYRIFSPLIENHKKENDENNHIKPMSKLRIWWDDVAKTKVLRLWWLASDRLTGRKWIKLELTEPEDDLIGRISISFQAPLKKRGFYYPINYEFYAN